MPKNVKKQITPAEEASAGFEKAPVSTKKRKASDKAKAPTTEKKTEAKPRAPKVKDWTATAAYRKQYEALEAAVLKAKGEVTVISCDRIDEYMDFWTQRKMLGDDIRKRGPTVLDERGRQSENRSISLALQVSKQMLELYKAMGLAEEPERAGGSVRKGRGAAAEDDEDDEL